MILFAPMHVVVAAFALDLVLGDPAWLPHPVRAIGAFVRSGERVLRTGRRRRDLRHGTLLALATVLVAALATAILLAVANRFGAVAGTIAAILVAWTTLALRGLADAALAVALALESGDVAAARRLLPALVGRDPASLDEAGIARAAVESVAENASDGVVAPLFYLVVAGPVGAIAYKAVNTLDSMIGHLDEEHRYFGRFAARLDDAANWVPARLTALCLVMAAALTGGSPVAAARAVFRDARRHRSPNAGWPEAAAAGALGLRLGGPVTYDGTVERRAWLGEGRADATPADVRSAVTLLHVASFLALAGLLVFRIVLVR